MRVSVDLRFLNVKVVGDPPPWIQVELLLDLLLT